MASSMWPLLLCVGVAIVFVFFPSPPPLVSLKEKYSHSLVSFVANTKNSASRVAIAYNDCLDLIVKGIPVLKALGVSDISDVSGPPSDFEQISSLDEVVRLFTLYHKQGSAVERHVTDGVLFDRIVEESKKQKNAQYFAGGNAALMANGLAKKGSTVLLGGPVGRGMRQFLHSEISFPSLDVEWKDEIHLILEFERQEEWSGAAAPRANRMILTHDVNNINIKDVMNSFGESAAKFNPDMVVLTGFHMLGSEEKKFRETQILKAFSTYDHIANGKNLPLHVELASMGSAAYWAQLLRLILPRTHSIGLNEQELFSVYSALGGKEFVSTQFISPDPKLIMATIAYVFEASKSEVFQRVHFHCLHFHLVALRQTKRANGVWPRERGGISVAAGALTTTQNACFEGKTELILTKTDELDLFLSDTMEVPLHLPSPSVPFSPQTRSVSVDFQKSPFFHVSYPSTEFFLSPILVCKFPKKTVGLGDSISSAGLAYSL